MYFFNKSNLVLLYVLYLNKMWKIRLTKSWLVDKALVAESTEIFRLIDSVINDESRHSSPAGLSPYGLYLQVAALADIEQWLNDTDLLTDTLPIK